MKKIYLIPAIMMLIASCGNNKKEQASGNLTKDSTKVEDTTAVSKAVVSDSTAAVDGLTSATAMPNHTSYNGKLIVTAQHKASVTMTMGGKIHSTSLVPGTFIRRGTVIATIDNPEFIQLQRDFIEAHAQLSYLQSEYNRQSRLSAQEAASQKHFQQSKADYMSMRSRYQADAIQLRNMGVSPSVLLRSGIRPYFHVYAPISGYVANVNINIGKYLQVGDPVCDVIDKSDPVLCLTAYEKDLSKLSIGNQVQFRVNGFGTKTFYATVTSISQEVDNTNRSIEVYAKVKSNNKRFRPGMYVTAHVENR